MPVSIKDIAEACGVSRQTVSGILNGRAHLFREDTRKKVEKALDRMGYRPNAGVEAMKTGRFNSFALLQDMNGYRSTFNSDMLRGIENALNVAGCRMVLQSIPDDKWDDAQYLPDIIGAFMVDGLIINYHVSIPQRMLDYIEKYNMPAIWINSDRETDVVRPDDVQMGELLTQHFIDEGHTRISYHDQSYYYSPRENFHYSRQHRYDGYLAAMKKAGLEPNLIAFDKDPKTQEGANALYRDILSSSDAPTAIVTNSGDSMRICLLAAQQGKHIGKDFFIGKIDASPNSSYSFGVMPDWLSIGRHAVDMLIAKREKPEVKLDAAVLPGILRNDRPISLD